MSLIIEDDIMSKIDMTPSELLLEIAVFLYQQEKLTLAQAARLSGIGRLDFQLALKERQIPIHFSVEDLQQEL
jgi:predicted HTH domain antitoxin